MLSKRLYLLIHGCLLWLIRSLYFHTGLLEALLDGGLLCLGAVLALGTLQVTASSLMSIWVFFLVQALFVTLPNLHRRSDVEAAPAKDKFASAQQRAEAALTQLISR